MQEAARVGKKRAPEMVVTWIEIQAYNIGRAYGTLSSLRNRKLLQVRGVAWVML